MNNFKHLAIGALAVATIVSGCGVDSDSPSDPGPIRQASFRVPSECGEPTYLSALSPVLPVWEDSIEIWLSDAELLDTPPEFMGESTADYLGTLVPVLQQWEGAINTRLSAAVVDTVADFNSATTSRQQYLAGLSSLLGSWKTDLETNRGTTFLPALPVFQPDETAPEIVCVADTIITCAPDEGVVFEYEVTAIDDCDPAPTVTCEPPSGSMFSAGETVVTCTAVDSLGNSSTCSFTVTVEGGEPPVIVRATASPATLWPPNHKMVDVRIDADIESECDADVTCTIVEVTSNEPDDATGDGNTSPDWVITGNGRVQLRAERSGNGSGRIYTVHFVCEDAFGNTVEGSANVVVPHDRGGKK